MPFRELEVEIAIDAQNNGLGIYATSDPANRTIFVGEMPDDIVEGILIVASASPPPHIYIDTEYKVIDFWSRSPHTDRSKALLRAVFELYHRRYHYTTDNWYVSFSEALGDIIDIDRDANSGKLFRLSVQFISRNLNHIS